MMARTTTPRAGAATLAACLLAAAGGASADAGNAGFGARLLLAQKDGHVALLLPESHIGSPAQEDPYFRNVIRPAFAASSALLAERSSVSWFDKTYDQAGCPVESDAEAALDPALNDALRRHAPPTPPELPAALRSLPPVDRIATLGRFMRFYLLFMDAHQRAYGAIPAEAGARSFTVRNAQSGILLAGAPRHAGSVEDTGTWVHAYCAIRPAERASLIAETIRQSAQPADLADAGKSGRQQRDATYRDNDAAYRRALNDIRAALRAPVMADDSNVVHAPTAAEAAINKFTLVERSRAWMADLPTVLGRERLPFYALGAAHFADSPSGPGLVTLLREAGYKVTLLNDRRALDAALTHLPPPAPPPGQALTMRALPGGCARSGDSYGCHWSDRSTSYLVVNTEPAGRREAWSACFEREGMYGPEKRCVSSIRSPGAERAADLASVRPPSPSDP